jgi:AraC-like DNA-binding protein
MLEGKQPKVSLMSANEQSAMNLRNELRGNGRPMSGQFHLPEVKYRTSTASSIRKQPRRAANDEDTRIGSLFSQLCSSSREEIARLANIARELCCSAAIRSMDGRVQTVAAGQSLRANTAETLALPVYGIEGAPLAHLEVTTQEIDHPALANKLIRAVVEPLARAMSERWFRIAHRKYWILAARQASNPKRCILLAMDEHFHLAGVDHGARQMLKESGVEPISPALSRFFCCPPDALARARHFDTAVRLPGASDGESWLVLITAPDLGADQLANEGGASVHSRPRLESIAGSCAAQPEEADRPGLPRYLARRIEEFVGTRLEAGIDIAELANSIGYSTSHFFRMFRRWFGMTPHAYLMRRRLVVAKELLTSTDISLAEIALKVGFCDQSHLSRSFRRFSGLPPRAFRVQHRDCSGGAVAMAGVV